MLHIRTITELELFFVVIQTSVFTSLPGRIEPITEFNFNMATPTSSHMVGRCFVATETGTYFDGTGYLKAGETRHRQTTCML